MEEWLSDHFEDVLDALATGSVVPLLGAGANLCDRTDHDSWVRGSNLPSGGELARYLADKLHYPDERSQDDLVRVSQYGQAKRGSGTLFRYLHEVFADSYEPTALHHLLARCRSVSRSRAGPAGTS